MSVDTSNTNVAAGVDSLRARVTGAIKQAAAVTGASFHYLLATAKMESDFNPSAGASTSSAHGLYQFIEQTWLATVKEAGAQVGYGQYADAITKTASGDYVVVDPVARRDIMKLRDDPAVSAAMAGVLTQSNSFQLTGRIGRRPTDGELYMAHFMGVGGAARLINSAVDDPQASAARMFPAAAAANRSIFYDRQGNGRTVSEVYAVIAARYDSAAGASATQSALAMYGTPATSASAASAVGAIGAAATPALDSASFLSQIPDVRNAAPASVGSASGGDANSHPVDPMFRSLFLVDDRSQPVSSTVHQLWGRSASLTADAAVAAPASNNDTPRPLDLFSDRNGTFAG